MPKIFIKRTGRKRNKKLSDVSKTWLPEAPLVVELDGESMLAGCSWIPFCRWRLASPAITNARATSAIKAKINKTMSQSQILTPRYRVVAKSRSYTSSTGLTKRMLAVSLAGHWERTQHHHTSTCVVLVFHALLIIQHSLHLDYAWGWLRFQPFFGIPTKLGVVFFL